MSINEQDIIKLANLAKLDLEYNSCPEFKNKLIDNLNNILHLVDQLQNVDTSNVEPMFHSDDSALQRLRPDYVLDDLNSYKELQSIAPTGAIESGLYLVPKVIDAC
jgi:aspartyl-tRNA(Asn)/glutamyl-tRNA(Gln) amidotransferase subunit C